jgi:hypothetical protein
VAKAELTAATKDGAMAELERDVDLTEADATLDIPGLELGLPSGGEALPPAGRDAVVERRPAREPFRES